MPDLAPRAPFHSEVRMLRLMQPSDANPMGAVFGGTLLAEIDRAAYIASARHTGGHCVTASFDRVDFRAPVRVGDIVHFDGIVTYAGRTSLEVSVKVQVERVGAPDLHEAGNAFVTMVAVDREGRPRPVPPVDARSPEELELLNDGERRMQERRRTRVRLG